MKLRHKIAISMAVVFSLFAVALGMAIVGLNNVTSRFSIFIDKDQAFLTANNTLYAQGLQGGQAVRNIILTRENPVALKNLSLAREEFRKALHQAQQLAGEDQEKSRALGKIAALQQEQTRLQDRIIALAKDDQSAATALLNSQETPLWRQVRSELLDLIKKKNDEVDKAKVGLNEDKRFLLLLSAALAGCAVVIGAGVAFWLTRDIMRQLGGEPDYAASIATSIANGDLTAQVIVDDESNTASLMHAIRAMQQNLAGLVEKVRNGTESITLASNEIATGNQNLSARTEEQASSLQETAASMEQLTTTVQQNAESVQQANALAGQASAIAVKGGEAVAEVIGTMDSINEAAKRIVEIISVIDGIAFQTNILALNAAVEAARAGEQGRGFAVVATEVRSLAQRSAEAAKEIKALIGDSVDRVATGTKLVNSAGATMQEVVSSVKRVTDLMSEITLAGQEQSSGIAQVNQAVSQMDHVTQQNAVLVEEAAAAADSMRAQAEELTALVATFRLAAEATPLRSPKLHPAAPRRSQVALVALPS